METRGLLHILPTLEMLGEALSRAGLDCRARGGDGRRYRGARLFSPGAALSEDVVYVLDEDTAALFPPGRCACAGAAPRGDGPALLCPGAGAMAVLDALLALFMTWREMEERLDALVFSNGSLGALCELGAGMLDNPLCVHDDWFVMIARSEELPGVLPPDTVMSSTREFIPRVIVEDFKGDTEYLETYVHRTAQLWQGTAGLPDTLYVNLWEGSVYRGRLLVVRYRRDFQGIDFAIAEVLAQRALVLLGQKQLGLDRPHRSMDDIVYDLLQGKNIDAQEERGLLELLKWGRGDRMLCVRVESQQRGASSLMEHTLHSDLFQVFPEGYILFDGHQQCLILNVSRNPVTTAMLSHRLAPVCRDYCLYAGISSPVSGLGELPAAWQQAGVALERAFQLRSERWVIPFSDCAMDYLLSRLSPPVRPIHIVAPELLRLRDYDAAHGTPYFETLRAYLLQERDIPRTSQALIIHRTTLLYRLKKLEGLLGLDLDDPACRLRLLLSLWILEREKP